MSVDGRLREPALSKPKGPAKRSEANHHERLNVATAAFGCRTSAASSPS